MSRTLKLVGKIGGSVLTVIGLVSLPDDIDAWGELFGGDILSYALIVLGVLLFAAATFAEPLRARFAKDATYIKGRTFDTAALLALTGNEPEIVGRTFDGCTFVGPLLIGLNGAVQIMPNNTFHFENQHEKAGAFWDMPENVDVVQGFFRFTDCRFERCTFRRIGWAVNDESGPVLRKAFGV